MPNCSVNINQVWRIQSAILGDNVGMMSNLKKGEGTKKEMNKKTTHNRVCLVV